MAVARLNDMFSSVSGALTKINKKSQHAGDQKMLLCTHRTAATTSPNCNRVYVRNLQNVTRTTPVSTEELALRGRFAAVSAAVASRAKDLNKMGPDKTAFNAQKDQPGGKKTMKKYLWSLELAAWDDAHPQG